MAAFLKAAMDSKTIKVGIAELSSFLRLIYTKEGFHSRTRAHVSVQSKYRAFISYSHRDEAWATWLHKALETYRVPKRLVGQTTGAGTIPGRLAPVFRDRDELPSATNLGDVLTEALRSSANLIVICSPAAARSQWVNEEILGFKRLGRADRIFCLIVDGEPWASDDPSRADEECFPRSLRLKLGDNNQLSDLRAEPIAADVRPQGDGRTNAKLKLISGLLGVGFDDLKQREQHRRHRRMAAVATAASIGMLVASGLAAFAFLARAEADRQRMRAEAETRKALATRDFMVGLFQAPDPSRAVGETITAKDLLDDGAARIATELAGQPDIQTTLMDTMGQAYTGLGLYSRATDLLEASLSTRRGTGSESPSDLAHTLELIAEVLARTAQYERANQLLEESLELRAGDTGMSEREHRLSLAGTQTALADVLARLGEYEQAEPFIRQALATRQELLGSSHAAVAESLEDLGLNEYYLGHYELAIQNLQAAVDMHRQVHDKPYDPAISEAISNLALVYLEIGDYERAESLYREALENDRKVYGQRHPELSTTLNNLALVYQDMGNLEAAEDMYEQVIDMDREFLPADHPQLAMSIGNLAWLKLDKGELDRAIELQEEALDMFQRVYVGAHPDVASAHSGLGFMLTQAGDFAAAEPHLKSAYEMRRTLLGEDHPEAAKSLMTLANLHLDTGRFEVAQDEARRAVAIFEKALGPDHWLTGASLSIEGGAVAGLGQYEAAEKILLQAHSVLEQSASAMPVFVDATAQRLVDLYGRMNRPDRAAMFASTSTPSD